MGRTLDKSLLIGLGLLITMLVAIAILNYKNTHQLKEDAQWVAHTHEVLDLTSDVLLTLVNAETGQRGFLLTGKEEFLQPYIDALKQFDGQMAALKAKTNDNDRQVTYRTAVVSSLLVTFVGLVLVGAY